MAFRPGAVLRDAPCCAASTRSAPHLFDPGRGAQEQLPDGILERGAFDGGAFVDELPEVELLGRKSGAERREGPISCQPGWNCLEPGCRAIAAPRMGLQAV